MAYVGVALPRLSPGLYIYVYLQTQSLMVRARGKESAAHSSRFPSIRSLESQPSARAEMALRGRAAAAAVARFIAGGALRRSSAALASFGFRPASSAAASADERRAPESLLGMGETALTRLAREAHAALEKELEQLETLGAFLRNEVEEKEKVLSFSRRRRWCA